MRLLPSAWVKFLIFLEVLFHLVCGYASAQCLINPTSIITTFAGTGVVGNSGDNGPAMSAKFSEPYYLCFDSAGNLYICDFAASVVRKIDNAGIITTVAGNGIYGYSGDGGPATSAELMAPSAPAFDSQGNLYIADRGSFVIRKVATNGIITTFAGNGTMGYSGDGATATSAQLVPYDLIVDNFDNLLITEPTNHVIRKITPAGIISTFAGTGTSGYLGDGGPAISAKLNNPEGIVWNSGASSVYFWDDLNYVVRKIDSCGIITTFAGNGHPGHIGDGGPAVSAEFVDAEGLAIRGGNLYLSSFDDSVRKIDSCGYVWLLGGSYSAIPSSTGDNGPFSNSTMADPQGIVFDTAGNLLVAERGVPDIRKVAFNCSPTPPPLCAVVPTATPACTQPFTPTPTPTPVSTLTNSPTPSPTPTASLTPTLSPTTTPTNSTTNTPTASPTSTPTLTPTFSPTPSISHTPTLSPTNTPSLTPTLTYTPTPTLIPTCEIHVWPVPFSPVYAVRGTLKVDCLPDKAMVSFFTLSGERVRTLPASGGLVEWDGRNESGQSVSTGTYYYVAQNGSNVFKRGKILLINH